jgi:hypothetical protein
VSSSPHDQGPKPSNESAANATQPSDATPATPELKRGPLAIKITDEQAARIF